MAIDVEAGLVDQVVTKFEEAHRAELVARLGATSRNDLHKRKSAAFVALCAKSLLDVDEESAIALLVDGGDDAGVDAVHLGDVADKEFTVTLFQGKYSKSLEARGGFPANSIGRIIETIRHIFDANKTIKARDELKVVLNEIKGILVNGTIPQVRVFLCNNGRPWEADGEARISEANLPLVNFVHVSHKDIVRLLRSQKPVSVALQTVGSAIQENFEHRRTFIGRLPVREIHRLFEAHGDLLLDRNIRRYLGLRGNRVNHGIYTTLENRDSRGNFYLFNNGITATCTKFTHNALQQTNVMINVENMQIVNGGQTCKTIQRRINEDPSGDYDKCSVLLRVYELSSDDSRLVGNITFATNSQNPVDLADLRANDVIQEQLALGLKQMGYDYKRKRDDLATGSDTITSAVAAEALMAVWQRRPHAAKFNRVRLFGDFYEQVFPPSVQPAHVVLSVLIFRMVESERKRKASQHFVPYASHFLAMVVGDLLLTKAKLSRDDVTHEHFEALRNTFEANRKQLYVAAVERIEKALRALDITSATGLPRVAAQFRRGDLLAPLERELTKSLYRARAGRAGSSGVRPKRANSVDGSTKKKGGGERPAKRTPQGQSGEPIDDLVPNDNEEAVAKALASDTKPVALAQLGTLAFPGAERGNSWARNALRRLVRAGWAIKVGKGKYVAGAKNSFRTARGRRR